MDPIRTLGAALCATLAVAMPASAEGIAVTFAPPDVEERDVCVPRPPSHVLAARWEGWEGGEFPEADRPVSLIRRDLRLLRQEDAERWFDTVEAGLERLLETVPDYDETDMRLDRIDLLVDAGRLDTLRAEGHDEWLLREAVGKTGGAGPLAAELLWNGTALPRDEERAIALWRDAAYAGHATALLELASISTQREIEDWNIAPDVAVTMAFGALLGSVDETICDRINRLAEHYRAGRVVQQDKRLAESWYRLSAQLGDFNAAWQVVSLHSEGLGLERDVEVMLAHLEQAADAGLTYAMSELASIFELGAIVDADPERARALYVAAAEAGSDAAQIRLVNMLRADAPLTDDKRTELRERLTALTEGPDPDAWVHVELADLALVDKGRWAGEQEAREHYARALEIEPDHSSALRSLARLELRDIRNRTDFEEAAAKLRSVVRTDGLSAPMQTLRDAYSCQTPGAPETDNADFWAEMERFGGDETVELNRTQLRNLTVADDPLRVAQLQTQAINGRAQSVANFLAATGTGLLPETGDALHQSVLRRGSGLYREMAKTDLVLGRTAAAEDDLRKAVDMGEAGARVSLLEHLFTYGSNDTATREEMLDLAGELARDGIGAGLETLAALSGTDAATLYEEYSDAIERNGDFDALAFALPHLQDEQRQIDYMHRARTVIDCNSVQALKFARTLDRIGQSQEARHWLEIARATVKRPNWELVAIADMMLARGLADNPVEEAAALYRRSAEAGYAPGMQRLLSLREDGRITLPVTEAADLYVALARSENLDAAVSAMAALDNAPSDVRRAVEARVDREGFFREAAAQGNPQAQFELAGIIQTRADSPEDLAEYGALLTGAAEQGHSGAMRDLSRAYAYGIGVPPDPELSRTWLRRAADAGDEDALRTVRMLGLEGGDE